MEKKRRDSTAVEIEVFLQGESFTRSSIWVWPGRRRQDARLGDRESWHTHTEPGRDHLIWTRTASTLTNDSMTFASSSTLQKHLSIYSKHLIFPKKNNEAIELFRCLNQPGCEVKTLSYHHKTSRPRNSGDATQIKQSES